MPGPSPARIVGAAIAAMTVGVLPVHLTGALAPELQDELGFGDAELGVAIAVFFAVSAVATRAGGRLSDRIGPAPAMRRAALWSSLSLLALAVVTRSYPLLVVLLGVSTIGTAISQPGSNVLVTEGVSTARRGLALGTKQAGVPVSTLLAGLAVPLLAETLGWRWAYAGGVLMGVLAIVLLPRRVTGPARSTGIAPAALRDDRRWPALRLLFLAGCFGAAAVAPISTFVVRTAEEAGLTPSTGGLLLATGSAFLICVRIAAGATVDRTSAHPFGAMAGLLLAGVGGYLLFAVGRPLTLWIGTILAFGAGWGWPGLFNLGVVGGFPDVPGAASGVSQSGIFTGAVIGPLVFGLLADTVGFGPAWCTSALWSLAAAACVLLAKRTLERVESDRPSRAVPRPS